MNNLLKALITATCLLAPVAVFASGDYVWEEKFKQTLPKAEQGDAESQFAIGEMYERGRGVDRDLEKAFSWFAKAAKQNEVKAAHKLGLAYLEGNGTAVNLDNARTWFKRAADQGYARSQYYMGEIYAEGKGVARDYDEATRWFKLALQGGYAAAAERLDDVAEQRAENERKLAQKRDEDERKRSEPAKRASAPTPPVAAAPAVAPAPAKTTAEPPKNTKQRILAGGWKQRGKDSDVLPAESTVCSDRGNTLECDSQAARRNIGMADIVYTTKAIIFGILPDGTFKISYRNNVTEITITDPEFQKSGQKLPVTLGPQDAEHLLVCRFENDAEIKCEKDKIRVIVFNR